MKKALVYDKIVRQISEDNFFQVDGVEVKWIECDDSVEHGDRYINNKFVKPDVDIAELKKTLLSTIDSRSGFSRQLTDQPGQDLIYLLKDKQARDFKEKNYEGEIPAFIAVEMTVRECSAQEATDLIILKSDASLEKLAEIELKRLQLKKQVNEAITVEQLTSIKIDI